MTSSELIVLAGCYGSGKTNLAVNLALSRRREGRSVIAVDLDVINPYFRMTDGAALLREAGVECLFSEFVNTNVDLPQHFPKLRTLFSEPPENTTVVVDVGGDDTGAVALGQYAEMLKKANAKVLLVLNKYRPFVQNTADARESISAIEAVSRLSFTGIAANPNLGRETTAETITSTVPYYVEMSRELGIPVEFSPVLEELVPGLELPWPVLPIRRFLKPGWEIE
ncbi:MAG: hypothetical protein PUA83_10400 [Clostridiales bacterium]|nr:hypothetical protein [Clostridiales bacterium]